MSTYFFFSGFDISEGFPPEIAQQLQSSIPVPRSLVLVASCPFDHEKTDFYANGNVNWFRKIGMDFERVDILDDRKTEEECVDLIQNASAIFLCGGTTILQMEFLQKNHLVRPLRQVDCTIMGMSAGAINMAVHSFYSADEDCERTHIYSGIGLADVSIEPHFSLDNQDLLEKHLLPFSEKIDIYAVCDNGAIVVRGDQKLYLGDVYLLRDGKIVSVQFL